MALPTPHTPPAGVFFSKVSGVLLYISVASVSSVFRSSDCDFGGNTLLYLSAKKIRRRSTVDFPVVSAAAPDADGHDS
ncbi:hypothetical protein WN943_018787 [Citrus x changshan-huyou]|uniref:Uncharacterized protein n=1 Tax=Citrus sinensis TaxID=2711 RepID=A0A067EVS6_CITSI|nr:hypothetical protein CISIN_1g041014mg [Citrus sinensis]